MRPNHECTHTMLNAICDAAPTTVDRRRGPPHELETNLPSGHNARPEKWGSNEDKYTWYSVREINHTRKAEHKAMLKHVNAQNLLYFSNLTKIIIIARYAITWWSLRNSSNT